MAPTGGAVSHPQTGKQVVDHGFLAARAKVLEIAAFLDRLDRAHEAHSAQDDFRIRALRAAIQELSAAQPGRAARIQLIFSDLSTEPAPTAQGLKPAVGAALRPDLKG